MTVYSPKPSAWILVRILVHAPICRLVHGLLHHQFAEADAVLIVRLVVRPDLAKAKTCVNWFTTYWT